MHESYYDLYNFRKDGTLLSVCPLYFYELEESGYISDTKSNLHIKSRLNKDKSISWWEYYIARTRTRTYKLRPDGFFEITNEKVVGEIEP